MKKLTLIFLSVLFLSCGGSDDDEKRIGDNSDDDGDRNPQTESEFMAMQGNCPTPDLKIDVELNKKFCGTDDCLILFAGHWWWTNYQFEGHNNWWWNQGQSWSPRNAFVDGEGLHLTVRKDNLGDKTDWMASEVVAVFTSDKKTLAKTGYGTYLVSAKIKSASSWNQLDKNVAFGLFTYQKDSSWTDDNPYRELDLAEISRWGTPPCSNVSDKRLCEGNAQFAVQRWGRLQANVQRYTINEGVKEITLVMKWTGGKKPVTFLQYDGIYTLENLPPVAKAKNKYTSTADQNKFIPTDGCQLFHMNLWMGNYGEGNIHPGPSNGQTQEVVVTNFQYKPL